MTFDLLFRTTKFWFGMIWMQNSAFFFNWDKISNIKKNNKDAPWSLIKYEVRSNRIFNCVSDYYEPCIHWTTNLLGVVFYDCYVSMDLFRLFALSIFVCFGFEEIKEFVYKTYHLLFSYKKGDFASNIYKKMFPRLDKINV